MSDVLLDRLCYFLILCSLCLRFLLRFLCAKSGSIMLLWHVGKALPGCEPGRMVTITGLVNLPAARVSSSGPAPLRRRRASHLAFGFLTLLDLTVKVADRIVAGGLAALDFFRAVKGALRSTADCVADRIRAVLRMALLRGAHHSAVGILANIPASLRLRLFAGGPADRRLAHCLAGLHA